MHGLWRSTVVI